MSILCYSVGEDLLQPKCPVSHGCISEGKQVCVSFLCVYGRSKLRYQVNPELPTVMADPPEQACGKWCNPIYPCVSTLGRADRSEKINTASEQSQHFFLFLVFSANRKQRKCILWMKPSWQTHSCQDQWWNLTTSTQVLYSLCVWYLCACTLLLH